MAAKGKGEQTGKDVASLAGKLLNNPGKATKGDVKKLAASVLTQAPNKKK